MKLSSVAKNPISQLTREVTVPFGEDEVDHLVATVRSLGLREETKASLTNVQSYTDGATADDAKHLIATALVELVVRWNAQDEDGNTIPLDVDRLVQEDLDVLITLLFGILGALKNDPFVQTSKSSGSSGPTAKKPRKR